MKNKKDTQLEEIVNVTVRILVETPVDFFHRYLIIIKSTNEGGLVIVDRGVGSMPYFFFAFWRSFPPTETLALPLTMVESKVPSSIIEDCNAL